MKASQEKTYTYSERLHLDPEFFDDFQIDMCECGFSTRTFSRLSKAGIMTAGDLLCAKECDLRKISGFGQKCADEVVAFLQMLKDGKFEIKASHPKLEFPSPTKDFKFYKNYIYNGDFSFAEEIELTDKEKACLTAMQDGYDLLDHDLILQAKNGSNQLLSIQRMLQDAYETQKEREQLIKAVERIPEDRRRMSFNGYVNVFSQNESTRNILRNIYGADEAPLSNILKNLSLTREERKLALDFVEWCSFDIDGELQQLLNLMYKKEKMKVVLRERANNSTLRAVGQILGVTRERVRQIEKQARQIFHRWYNHTRILSKISLIRDGDYILTPVELQEYLGQYTSEILYLLRTTEDLPYLYDSQLDAFIVDAFDQSERVQNYVEELPVAFDVSMLNSIQEDAADKNLSDELLMLAINDAYTLTGNVYHRSRLSVREICKLILKNHYKDGMHVYDEQQLAEFRKYAETEFGNVGLPKQNRALASDITHISILCGRGTYKLDENEAISKDLLAAICNYIDESEKSVFLTNTLFSVFEEELLAEGIDNKYYLQGLMHKQLSDRYIFRRDYVSKDDSSTSIYMEIVNHIKKFDHPINKNELRDEYPGITDIVINLSVNDPHIINLHGGYIHAERLNFRKGDIEYFKSVLETMMSKDGYCNVKDVYARINAENPISMRRLYIMQQSNLFGVLEYLFRNEFQFSRPYIAYPGVEIFHASERMDELIRNADEITLAEINEYAKEIHFGSYSILDLVDKHNDTHLLKNDKELISIEESGVDEACAKQIEKLILDEIEGTTLISELLSVYKFPRVAVPWTEWLIYSVLKKWSDKLEVGAESSISARQFRCMHPIVAVKGKLSVDEVVLTGASGIIAEVDDLDDIDDLISDIIVEELGDLSE